MRHRSTLVLLVIAGIGAGASIALGVSSRASLLDWTFQSGWLLVLLVAALTIPWWFPGSTPLRRARIGHFHPLLLIALWVAYLGHTGLRLPQGWVERVLLVAFAALTLSLLFGRARLRDSSERAPVAFRHWCFLQSVVTSVLLAAALFHGLFVHAHGLLAHLFLGR